MRPTLFVALILLLATDAIASTSIYRYRVSPSNAPLKEDGTLYAPPPEYPAEARRQHLSGSGLFILHVASDGSVAKVEIFKSIGHRELDQAATRGFRRWRFHPRTLSIVRVPIRYIAHPHRPDSVDFRPPENLGDGVQITIATRAL